MTSMTASRAADLVAALLFVLSLAGLSQHRTSRAGVVYGIAGMALALAATVVVSARSVSAGPVALILLATVIGAAVGLWRARRVEMTQMPELIAVLHSFVGLAAVLVGWNSYPGRARPRLAGRGAADTAERLCLANVVQQLEHLRAHDSVARALGAGDLELHGMYFHVGEAQSYLLSEDAEGSVFELVRETNLTA